MCWILFLLINLFILINTCRKDRYDSDNLECGSFLVANLVRVKILLFAGYPVFFDFSIDWPFRAENEKLFDRKMTWLPGNLHYFDLKKVMRVWMTLRQMMGLFWRQTQ